MYGVLYKSHCYGPVTLSAWWPNTAWINFDKSHFNNSVRPFLQNSLENVTFEFLFGSICTYHRMKVTVETEDVDHFQTVATSYMWKQADMVQI